MMLYSIMMICTRTKLIVLLIGIVRPTAFFKSVSGQLEVIQQGAPFVMFGDGEVTRCNPISEADLATYLIDSIADKSRENKIINLGGPDEPLTMKRQGEMLYKAVGKEPHEYLNDLDGNYSNHTPWEKET